VVAVIMLASKGLKAALSDVCAAMSMACGKLLVGSLHGEVLFRLGGREWPDANRRLLQVTSEVRGAHAEHACTQGAADADAGRLSLSTATTIAVHLLLLHYQCSLNSDCILFLC
jgi:hypothetical protein